MPVDFGHVVHGPAAGVHLPVVFSDGHREIFGTETDRRRIVATKYVDTIIIVAKYSCVTREDGLRNGHVGDIVLALHQ